MYAAYKTVENPELDLPVGTGWLPPLPDLRDFTDGFFSYYPGEKMTFEEFISRADAMMYERKRSKHRE